MPRQSSTSARRAGLIAVAAALAAAVAAAGARLSGRATPVDRARDLTRRFRRSSPQTYTCACGASYRVSGTDRHRVYWPADAPEDAPVMGDRCVECEATLPAGRALGPA